MWERWESSWHSPSGPLWRRLRLAAAKRNLTIQQSVLEAIEDRPREDLRDRTQGMLALTETADPVLAQVWDTRRDAEYDRLSSVVIRADQVIQ